MFLREIFNFTFELDAFFFEFLFLLNELLVFEGEFAFVETFKFFDSFEVFIFESLNRCFVVIFYRELRSGEVF